MRMPSLLSNLARLTTALAITSVLPAQWTGEWPLDHTTGVTAIDISGSNNHGLLMNFTGSQWVTGMFGNALQFSPSVDDYVELPATGTKFPVYDGLGSPYSITYWIKAPNIGANQGGNVYTEGHDNTAGKRALFMLHGGGATGDRVRLLIRTNQPRNVVLGESNAPVYDDTWHHVAVTEVSGVVSIYVDGILDNTIPYFAGREPGTPGYTQFEFNRFSIGAVVRGTGIIDELNGTIDDFRIYDFALSPTDVGLVRAGAPLLPARSNIGEYGVGCGSGPFDLAGSGSAAIGGPGIQLLMQSGAPFAPAFLLIGFGSLAPVDLGSIGFVGCRSYPAIAFSVGTAALDASGTAPPVTIPVPNNPSLSSLQANFQAAALNVSAATLEFSDAVLATIGL